MTLPSTLDALLCSLPELAAYHAPASRFYGQLKGIARAEVKRRFGPDAEGPQEFGPFNKLTFPYYSMGAITSLDLFGLDELIIFAFYWANRHLYTRVADVGANIGLHSIILDRCGYEVRAFEPDPIHFERLVANLKANGCYNVKPIQAAVSAKAGVQDFVRVLGNTTGSHLAGSKPNPYGNLERFPVPVKAIAPLMEWADLLKIDVEGHEAAILEATSANQWTGTDALVEVGTAENAAAIFAHLSNENVNMFAQKLNWDKVRSVADLPTSWREGSLFVTTKPAVPWMDPRDDAPVARA